MTLVSDVENSKKSIAYRIFTCSLNFLLHQIVNSYFELIFVCAKN